MMGTLETIRVVLAGAVIVTALAVAPAISAAASPEEIYFATRDAAIEKIKAFEDAKNGEAATKESDRATPDLEQQMRTLLGPLAIKGLPAVGTLNLGSLWTTDQGYGTLDGLLFGAPEDKTHVIVTTEGIFRTWLTAHKAWWGDKMTNVPQDPTKALASTEFFTQAIMTDAAVMKFTQIPVRAPSGATYTFAMLAARSQDDSPPAPDEIFVALVQGGRVYVAYTNVARKFATVPACDAVRQAQETKSDAIYTRYQAADPKDEKLFDQYTAARELADTLFLRCYAEKAGKQAAFAPALQQAQALLESLPLQ
jgi:hypothetical protein